MEKIRRQANSIIALILTGFQNRITGDVPFAYTGPAAFYTHEGNMMHCPVLTNSKVELELVLLEVFNYIYVK